MSEPHGLRSLRVEGRERPRGLDVGRPRFTWVVAHPAHTARWHRVIVQEVSTARTIWDSGEVAGDAISETPVDSLALQDLCAYRWQVTVHVSSGEDLTAESWFDTGLLTPGSWSGSTWIAGSLSRDPRPAPLLRHEFDLPAPAVRAWLAVAAGGIADVHIDGEPVGDEVLGPSLTDYDARVHYVIHDVTALLGSGPHALSVALGRGFYGMTTENTWAWHLAPWHDEPCVRLLLVAELEDGSVARVGSGHGWRASRGGTLADSFYEGESFDSDLEPSGWREPGFTDDDWAPARIVSGPRGTLIARPHPGIRVVEDVCPRTIDSLEDGRLVIDFGRQVAGWVRLNVPATGTADRDEIILRLAERLVDGVPQISTPYSAGELQRDGFQPPRDGAAASWEPRFGYRGFQYAEVDGWPGKPEPGAFTARVTHTDVERTASFQASDALLTWIHEAVVSTMLNNLHHIPTDTPVFEKNGWTGDAMLAADMMVRDLDSVPLLEKWLWDVSDSRDADGRPALIAPTPGWLWPEHMESPPWHAAYPLIPWRIYLATGDERMVRDHAEGIFRYLRLEHRLAPDGLSDTGLGDYLTPDKSGNPDEDLRVCATVAVHDSTVAAARMAALIGDTETEKEFVAQARTIRGAFQREFFDKDAAEVRDAIAGYRQTHNILALDSGMLPAASEAAVAANLARDVVDHRDGHLWVGALGVRTALPVLDRFGHGEAAFAAATQRSFPSWGAWFEQGASTMWEYWDDSRSRNHYFLGTVDNWLFAHVAGVRLDGIGYRHVRIRPDHLARLDHAEATIETVRGELAISWEREGSAGRLRLTLPSGSTAAVDLPGLQTTAASGTSEHRFTLTDRTEES